MRGRRDLRQQRVRAHDRAGHEVRKEADEEREVAEVFGGLDGAAVDVDGVAHRLERVEADAGGQEDVQERRRRVGEAERGEERVGAADEEVAVLEEAEQAEVGRHAEDEEGGAAAARRVEVGQGERVGADDGGGGERDGEVDEAVRVRGPAHGEDERGAEHERGEAHEAAARQAHAGDAEAADEVDDRRYQDEKEESIVPESVKEVAGDEEELILPSVTEASVGEEYGEKQ